MDPTTQPGAASSPSLVDALKCLRGFSDTIVGVLFGPLRLRPETDETAKNIFRLLNIFGILDTDIAKISVHPKSDYVRIDFKSAEMADFVVMAVKEKSAVKRVYNFTRLSDSPDKLQAVQLLDATKFQELRDIAKLFADTAPAGAPSPSVNLVTYSPVDEDVLCVVKSWRRRSQEAVPAGTTAAATERVFELMPLSLGVDTLDVTMPLDMPEIIMDIAQPSVCNNPSKKDESMSTVKLPHPFWQGPPFYLFHGRVHLQHACNVYDNKVRINATSWERSINDIAYMLAVHVTCMANRRDGGSIFLGVTAGGLAEGFIIPSNVVDKLKLEIDNQMSNTIRPMLLPYSYKINYVKVIGNADRDKTYGTVIEVHVDVGANSTVQYRYNNKVCIYDEKLKKVFFILPTDKDDRVRW
ncbi:unnamed protein product [Lymnaea stagnalis]|uniref:Schlafen AlbA-2 domain-containing protein n=1 Tax=Lymnaea stagnalis TaxID=6523 RepID=A0AAV2IF83_LYMST